MIAPLVASGEYSSPRLSPLGDRVVFLNRADDNLWTWDLENNRDIKLTETDGIDVAPAWRDDTTVTFGTNDGDGVQVYSKTTAPGSTMGLIVSTDGSALPGSWTPDGEVLVFDILNDQGDRDIWWLPVGGERVPFLDSRANERAGRLSPDGQGLAYISDKDGENRIYVMAFPEGGEALPISDGSGTEPVWSRNGWELFYRAGNQLFSVAVEMEPAFTFERPHVLFDGPYEFGLGGVGIPGYDVSRDAEQFLMVQRNADVAQGYIVVLNWSEELNRLVPTNQMPFSPGTTLGPYSVTAKIGAGGMGEVYKARDTRLDRTVAIKVLPEHVATDPELKQRFEREAKTVAALSHPHICTLHDIGSQDGIDFLVMEYLDGETLAQRLEKGALPLDHALQIAIQIADALDKAHRQGIVHRDLKPGNIMLTKSGAKLLDFGLAKLKPTNADAGVSALPTQSAGLTGEGAILGTLQYMAPE